MEAQNAVFTPQGASAGNKLHSVKRRQARGQSASDGGVCKKQAN
jgi:hypothetical protein